MNDGLFGFPTPEVKCRLAGAFVGTLGVPTFEGTNIARVVRLSAGIYRVDFKVPAPTTLYAVTLTPSGVNNGATVSLCNSTGADGTSANTLTSFTFCVRSPGGATMDASLVTVAVHY